MEQRGQRTTGQLDNQTTGQRGNLISTTIYFVILMKSAAIVFCNPGEDERRRRRRRNRWWIRRRRRRRCYGKEETRGDTGGGKSRGGSLQSLPSQQTQVRANPLPTYPISTFYPYYPDFTHLASSDPQSWCISLLMRLCKGWQSFPILVPTH